MQQMPQMQEERLECFITDTDQRALQPDSIDMI
jgi:hypothetical protein